jgi:hypothetical protein
MKIIRGPHQSLPIRLGGNSFMWTDETQRGPVCLGVRAS